MGARRSGQQQGPAASQRAGLPACQLWLRASEGQILRHLLRKPGRTADETTRPEIRFIPPGKQLPIRKYRGPSIPDGTIYPMTGVFQEIVEPQRLVFTSYPLDKNGDPLFDVLNTVTFADERGRTKFTLHASVGKVRAEGVPHPAGMEQGWSEAVDRLRDRLAQELGENYTRAL